MPRWLGGRPAHELRDWGKPAPNDPRALVWDLQLAAHLDPRALVHDLGLAEGVLGVPGVPERKRCRPPRETFDRLAVATDRTPSGCGPRLPVPRQQQRKDEAADLAEANRPANGRDPVEPERGPLPRREALPASSRPRHHHRRTRRRGPRWPPEQPARLRSKRFCARVAFRTPFPLANRSLNTVTTNLSPCYSGARKHCPFGQVLATCFTCARNARNAAP